MVVGERPCIRVPKRLGEYARRRLAAQGLLDTGYRVRREDDHILFPLTRPLSRDEAKALGGEPCVAFFEERRRKPSSVKEFLEERLGGPVDAVYSYSMVGDIVLVSLRPDQVERYGKLIGEAIAAIHPGVRAVYAKVSTIGGFRVQKLIHLHGEKRTWTIYKEHGIRFWVDVARMYVNPSLAEEHRRVAEMVRKGERVLDMFSGFGGFSLHIARLREAMVVATDINPYAIEALRKSAGMNRLRGDVHPIQCDAGLAEALLRRSFTRIIANNPLHIHEFSRPLCSLVEEGGAVHYYLISGSEEEAASRARDALSTAGCRTDVLGVRRVLDYSPYRYIYAVDLEVLRATR